MYYQIPPRNYKLELFFTYFLSRSRIRSLRNTINGCLVKTLLTWLQLTAIIRTRNSLYLRRWKLALCGCFLSLKVRLARSQVPWLSIVIMIQQSADSVHTGSLRPQSIRNRFSCSLLLIHVMDVRCVQWDVTSTRSLMDTYTTIDLSEVLNFDKCSYATVSICLLSNDRI